MESGIADYRFSFEDLVLNRGRREAVQKNSDEAGCCGIEEFSEVESPSGGWIWHPAKRAHRYRIES